MFYPRKFILAIGALMLIPTLYVLLGSISWKIARRGSKAFDAYYKATKPVVVNSAQGAYDVVRPKNDEVHIKQLLDKCINYSTQSLFFNPFDSYTWHYRGTCQSDAGQYRKAKLSYRFAKWCGQPLETYLLSMVNLSKKSGNKKDEIKFMQEWSSIQIEKGDDFINMTHACMFLTESGPVNEAMGCIDKMQSIANSEGNQATVRMIKRQLDRRLETGSS